MDGTKKLRIKTFAVKSPRKKENKRPATSYVQYRCNVSGFANAMQLYKPMLQQRQDVINDLAETPFWSLIKFYMDDEIVATDRKKKSDMNLIKIIQCYDSKQQQFKFGDHEPKAITRVELPNTDKSIKNMKDSFVKSYFAKQKIVKKKDIVEAYQKLVQDKTPEGAKATASIICVHLLQSLLFATSGTYIAWSFITISKGVRDYLFKRINKSKKKRKNGEKSATTSGCTALILYWICLHTNLVETISGRENMIPAIGRWDITKIHKAIRDIRVEEIEIGGGIPCSEKPTNEHSNINQEECNAIPYPQQNNESSKKKEKKTTGRKRKRIEVGAEEDQGITITEAQSQFDQLYQKDFIGIDNTLGVEDFEKFKRCASMDQKRYLVLNHMMIYALDNLHTDSIVMNQTTGALNRNIENLLQERLEDKQKITASMKVNKLLDEIGSLKKKLLENQAIIPYLNASTKEDLEEDEPPKEDPDNDDQVEEHTHDKDTATEDPVQENATENDVAMEDQEHEGKDTATEKGTSGVQPYVQMQTPTIKDAKKQGKETAKKKTRTLVKNIRMRDDRKPNVDPHYDYIPIQRKQKKAKYIFAVSDSESPSIFPSESQPLEPIIEKGKEEPKVESPLNPIAKEIANKPAKKAAKKPVKRKLDKRYHLLASTRAYKLLEDETKEKFKEYYRKEKMQGSMVTDLVVLKSDLTSLFVDGAIDANIIDASFYTMAENE
ncbi:unnamed protein product [Malus baccata var. baccata]